MSPTQTTTTTLNRMIFIVEAQLFHGLTRKEALALAADEMDTLYDRVETITTSERGL
jgi:hypothetical protein